MLLQLFCLFWLVIRAGLPLIVLLFVQFGAGLWCAFWGRVMEERQQHGCGELGYLRMERACAVFAAMCLT